MKLESNLRRFRATPLRPCYNKGTIPSWQHCGFPNTSHRIHNIWGLVYHPCRIQQWVQHGAKHKPRAQYGPITSRRTQREWCKYLIYFYFAMFPQDTLILIERRWKHPHTRGPLLVEASFPCECTVSAVSMGRKAKLSACVTYTPSPHGSSKLESPYHNWLAAPSN
jgi:hypothetical protein